MSDETGSRPPGVGLVEATDAVMAENKRRYIEKSTQPTRDGNAWTAEQAERLWDTGESIHRNSVEWTLSVLLDLGYRITHSDDSGARS